MSGQSAIWWIKLSGGSAGVGTEASALADSTNSAKWTGGEVILFNETVIKSTGGHIFTSDFTIRNSVAENPKVDGNGNDVQDMGLDGIDVQITGLFKDSDSGNNDIKKLMAWVNEAKTTTGYTEGRFGLRIDDFPYFNMVPKSTYGYVLNNISFVRDPNKENRAGFVMSLRVGGDVRAWLDDNGYSGE